MESRPKSLNAPCVYEHASVEQKMATNQVLYMHTPGESFESAPLSGMFGVKFRELVLAKWSQVALSSDCFFVSILFLHNLINFFQLLLKAKAQFNF